MIIKHYQEQRLLHRHIYAGTSHVFWCCSFCRNMRPFFWTRRSLIFFLYCFVIHHSASIWKIPPDAENAMRIPSVIYWEETSNDVQSDCLTLTNLKFRDCSVSYDKCLKVPTCSRCIICIVEWMNSIQNYLKYLSEPGASLLIPSFHNLATYRTKPSIK